MRTYGHSYRDTMDLPMQVFWNISGTIPRLLAGERKDMLELMTAATHSPTSAQEMYLNLDELSPNPVTLTGKALMAASSSRDEAGVNDLRNMQ